jgi:lysophospholipase L1-like esterase
MRNPLVGRPPAVRRQRLLDFLERRLDHERRFKWAIVLTTSAVLALILAVVPWGFYLSGMILTSARQAGRQVVGLPPSREEVDASWRRFRQRQIEETRPRVERFYARAEPALQRLLRYASMDPDHGLLRWANYNWTILFSSKVFEADDTGRSYRFRPLTHSIWLTGVDMPGAIKQGVPLFLIVPDGPELADAIRGTATHPSEGSQQTTNSWGLRGPEPEPDAPLRGIVLGDSYMQGMFIGDDETPPECLRRYLEDRLKTRVSILNTGVMGYSPEQYYHSLVAFADRFRPDFVVVSVFPNDFGNVISVVTDGVGDWEEGKYWLENIAGYCRARHVPYLVVPVPFEGSVLDRRTSGFYPGRLLNILDVPSRAILNPFDDFVNAHLKWLAESQRKGKRLEGSPLYNNAINDEHLSAAGAEVWARSVGERVIDLVDCARASRDTPSSATESAGE